MTLTVGPFTVSYEINPTFCLPEVRCGEGRLFRSLSVCNTRGGTGDWLTFKPESDPPLRFLPRRLSKLPPGDTDSARTERLMADLILPRDTPPGSYRICLKLGDSHSMDISAEIPFTVELMDENTIPTGFDRARYLAAWVAPEDRLRRFAAEVLGTLPPGNRDPREVLRGLYQGLWERNLPYLPVPLRTREHLQPHSGSVCTLDHGGSCAELSLLMASLLTEWDVRPALLMFPDHMVAGCFTEELPEVCFRSPEEILTLLGSGRVYLADITGICPGFRMSFEEAEDAVRERLLGKHSCVLVNVEAAQQQGISPILRTPASAEAATGRQQAIVPPLPAGDLSCSGQRGGVCINRLLQREVRSLNLPEKWRGLTVRAIGSGAFRDTGITDAHLPDGITAIGDSAFAGCAQLEEVRLPDTLTVLGNFAFQGCGLRSLRIPDTLQRIPTAAFRGCRRLSAVTLQEGLTDIADLAFADCPGLRSVRIPASVRRIGPGAFDPGCEILLSSSLTVVE